MTFQPEIGQMLFGGNQLVGAHDLPNIAEAAVQYLMSRIEIVFWNINQREWDRWEDPKIAGIHYRAWRQDDESEDAEKPNFAVDGFEKVQIRWYKHVGRSMNCTVELTPNEWSQWTDKALEYIRKAQSRQD